MHSDHLRLSAGHRAKNHGNLRKRTDTWADAAVRVQEVVGRDVDTRATNLLVVRMDAVLTGRGDCRRHRRVRTGLRRDLVQWLEAKVLRDVQHLLLAKRSSATLTRQERGATDLVQWLEAMHMMLQSFVVNVNRRELRGAVWHHHELRSGVVTGVHRREIAILAYLLVHERLVSCLGQLHELLLSAGSRVNPVF